MLSKLTKGWLSLFCPLCFPMAKDKGTDMMTIEKILMGKSPNWHHVIDAI